MYMYVLSKLDRERGRSACSCPNSAMQTMWKSLNSASTWRKHSVTECASRLGKHRASDSGQWMAGSHVVALVTPAITWGKACWQ